LKKVRSSCHFLEWKWCENNLFPPIISREKDSWHCPLVMDQLQKPCQPQDFYFSGEVKPVVKLFFNKITIPSRFSTEVQLPRKAKLLMGSQLHQRLYFKLCVTLFMNVR
jgi:hypothetical protein